MRRTSCVVEMENIFNSSHASWTSTTLHAAWPLLVWLYAMAGKRIGLGCELCLYIPFTKWWWCCVYRVLHRDWCPHHACTYSIRKLINESEWWISTQVGVATKHSRESRGLFTAEPWCPLFQACQSSCGSVPKSPCTPEALVSLEMKASPKVVPFWRHQTFCSGQWHQDSCAVCFMSHNVQSWTVHSVTSC